MISQDKQARVAKRRAGHPVRFLAFGPDTIHVTMTAHANRRIRIRVGGVQLDAELKSSRTAEEIYKALPVEDQLNVWGEEFYFKVPGVKDHRETATTQVKIGDVAFWGAGQVLAIFFGRTPMSMGADPVPADRVNIVGRIIGDATVLRQAMAAAKIRVDPLE